MGSRGGQKGLTRESTESHTNLIDQLEMSSSEHDRSNKLFREFPLRDGTERERERKTDRERDKEETVWNPRTWRNYWVEWSVKRCRCISTESFSPDASSGIGVLPE